MMKIFSLLPLGAQIGIVAAVISFLGLGVASWHHKVYEEGYSQCTADNLKAIKEGEKLYEKTSIETQRLSDRNLRNEFCKWVRDADLSTCLKALPAFR